MPRDQYLSAPIPLTGMPPGVPYIVSNEAAERFSYYGMRAILVVFMTKYLVDRSGHPAAMGEPEARAWYHTFIAAVYFTSLAGAIISDGLLGKYRTIIGLSIVYCLGHFALAADETRLGLAVGLGLIAIGAGGIKPCVSAHVGDQFGPSNAHLLSKVFGWFYFAINFGAFASTLLIPVLLERVGPWAAFGLPGVLMVLATVAFWMGRWKFIHIPPGGKAFFREALGPEGRGALLRLIPVFLFVAVFWSLYDQTGSAWVLQTTRMDRTFLGHEWLPSQIGAINPLLIMMMIPAFSYGIYPALGRVMLLTPLRKMAIGFFLTVGAFALSARIEAWIALGGTPNIGWQILAYVVITAAEVMVSIVSLEFSYTQAPPKMKSFVMALYLLSISLGNVFTAGVNRFIQRDDGTLMLEGPSYYWFFTAVMAVTAAVFLPIALRYRERTYIHQEQAAG